MEKGLGKETKRFGVSVIFGTFQHGCWCLMHRQTVAVLLCMHSGFPTLRSEQTIVMSLYDVTRISHATVGGNYKRRA